MTSMPASRKARAMIFAPRSWPSRPGFAITTLIFRVTACEVYGGGVAGSAHCAIEGEAPPASFVEVPRLGHAIHLSLSARRTHGDAREPPFHQRRLRQAQELRQRTERAGDHVGRLAGTAGRSKTYVGEAPQSKHAGSRARDVNRRAREGALRLSAVRGLSGTRGATDSLGRVRTAERHPSRDPTDDGRQHPPAGETNRHWFLRPEGDVANSLGRVRLPTVSVRAASRREGPLLV